ncbi:lycopene beta-cyclase CrtY [Sphingobium sp. CR28]|uniref:lycopene beta-cyclase CrtY n=1 Tax=Sphingobium sp. CR28 TaxID=3400272 RepID=UPI003FEE02BD
MARPSHDTAPYDIAIVGAGLSGGLLALALRARRPELRLALIDGAPHAGGNHIWSFFGEDVAPEDRWLVDPLVTRAWSGHDVRFADFSRTLTGSYASIESDGLDATLRRALPADALMLGHAATELTPHAVRLASGQSVQAGAVIDARGAHDMPGLQLGWQKFLGQLWTLDAPHGLTRPTIMDATVDQSEGYRFVYLLPFSATEIFVEDTYYSTEPALDVPRLSGLIADYVSAKGWRGTPAGRAETGVLPVCMGGDVAPLIAGTVPRIGVGAGFFHALTGYSLPDAVRVAVHISEKPELGHESLLAATRDLARKHWKGQAFYRLLAAMLFRAAEPAERHRVLARFYRLDPALVARFYAGRSTFWDKLRIVSGRPPVPLRRAIAALGAPQ